MGQPANARIALPQNYPFISRKIIKCIPVFKDLAKSERQLAVYKNKHFKFIVIRPSTLKDGVSNGRIGYTINETSYEDATLPLTKAKTVITRDNVAVRMLGIAEMKSNEKLNLYSNAEYLT